MGVELKIDDARTVELASDLARQLNKSVVETIHEALEEKRVLEIRRRALVEEGMQIIAGLRAHWRPETLHLDARDLVNALYDERGLPV